MTKRIMCLLVIFVLTSSLAIINNYSSASAASTTTENFWVSKAPMQVTRSDLGAAVVDGKIFAIGGVADGKVVGINEMYDPTTDSWTFKAPMPAPSKAFATAEYQGKIYCIGAQINEVYNPANDSWENKTPPPLSYFQIVSLDERFYALDTFYSNTTAVYDPANDSWTLKAPIPIATGGTVVACNQNIYVIGTSSLKPELSLIQIYDPKTNSWTLSSTHSEVYGGQAIATTGIYAPQRIYFVEAQAVYDPLTGLWQTGRSLPKGAPADLRPNYQAAARIPTDRMEFAVAVLNDKIYAIGGVSIYSESYIGYDYKSVYHDTVEEYTPFGYGTVPPLVTVSSPDVGNYSSNKVSLNFTVNKPVVSESYCLDGKNNITIAGNITLTGLTDGLHNVTVYAEDDFENIGGSQTIIFNVDTSSQTQLQPQPLQNLPMAAILIGASVVAVVAVVGLAIYYKKRKR